MFRSVRLVRPLSVALASAGALLMSACAGSGSGLDDAGGVAADTIGLARDSAVDWRLTGDDPSVATPYGGSGAAFSCEAAARDIVRLTALLGADAESVRPQSDADSGDFASGLAEDAPELAADMARDTVVGLNPARPLVRFVAGAGEQEAEARRARELQLKRRAWLRGAFDASGCSHDTLVEALEAAGLSR